MQTITYQPEDGQAIECTIGEQVLPSGATLYLGFEALTLSNLTYWRHYYFQLHIRGEGLFLSNILEEWYSYDEEDTEYTRKNQFESLQNYAMFSSFVETTNWCSEMPQYEPLFRKALTRTQSDSNKNSLNYLKRIQFFLRQIPAGADNGLIDASTASTSRFIVYGSTQPITKDTLMRHCEHAHKCTTHSNSRFGFKFEGYDHVYQYFQDIVISVPYATDRYSPTFSHYGFVKNIWHAVDPDRTYRHVGIILKGFSAYVTAMGKHELTNKQYLTIDILRPALTALSSALGSQHIHVCDGNWDSTLGDRASFGENLLLIKIDHENRNGQWAIRDPDCAVTSDFYVSDKTLVGTDCVEARFNYGSRAQKYGKSKIEGCDGEYGLVAIKSVYLELFYRASGKIYDFNIMLPILTHLKHHNCPLPTGLATEIVHAFSSHGIRRSELTLDSAIRLYDEALPRLSDLSIFGRSCSVNAITSNISNPH